MRDDIKKEIRKKAALFRTGCKINHYGIADLFKCDQREFKIIRYPLGEKADLGLTIKKDDDVIIFTNSSVRLSREIFTLAHEIGHTVLHMNVDMPFIDDTTTMTDGSADVMEQEANYFAACLLMPDNVVREYLDLEIQHSGDELSALDIARIMSEFNISFDMALNRLEALGIIDSAKKLCLDNEKTEKKVGNLLRSICGNARLNAPSREIAIPYEYIDYVIYNYNHNAVPVETLQKVLACYELTTDDISDRLITHDTDGADDLDELIGGLDD